MIIQNIKYVLFTKQFIKINTKILEDQPKKSDSENKTENDLYTWGHYENSHKKKHIFTVSPISIYFLRSGKKTLQEKWLARLNHEKDCRMI